MRQKNGMRMVKNMQKQQIWLPLIASTGIGAAAFYSMTKGQNGIGKSIQQFVPLVAGMGGQGQQQNQQGQQGQQGQQNQQSQQGQQGQQDQQGQQGQQDQQGLQDEMQSLSNLFQ
jgi:hypothetical protein